MTVELRVSEVLRMTVEVRMTLDEGNAAVKNLPAGKT
jgi:hypothetical protein